MTLPSKAITTPSDADLPITHNQSSLLVGCPAVTPQARESYFRVTTSPPRVAPLLIMLSFPVIHADELGELRLPLHSCLPAIV